MEQNKENINDAIRICEYNESYETTSTQIESAQIESAQSELANVENENTIETNVDIGTEISAEIKTHDETPTSYNEGYETR